MVIDDIMCDRSSCADVPAFIELCTAVGEKILEVFASDAISSFRKDAVAWRCRMAINTTAVSK